MDLAVGADRNASLSAMWRAFAVAISGRPAESAIGYANTVVQTLDYYPYGSARIDTGSADSARKFIGQFADDPTALSYLNARYYDPGRGGFLSQDPVFWEVGQTSDGRAALSNPQVQNSYSYAEGNPITRKDPNGRSPLGIGLIIGGVGYGGTWYSDIRENQRQGITGLGQFGPRQGFVSRGAASTLDVAIGFLAKNPIVSGFTAAGTSITGDLTAGQNPNYGNAFRSGIIAFGSDLVLGPLNDAAPTLKRDIVHIFSSGALNLGGSEFFKNIQWQQSQQRAPSLQPRYYTPWQPGGGGSLPATVSQNGTTYYRNSSGLLSLTPEKKQ